MTAVRGSRSSSDVASRRVHLPAQARRADHRGGPAVKREVGPNLFAIPFGLAGLAGVWRLMAQRHGAPPVIADAIFLAAGLIWLALLGIVSAGAAAQPRKSVSRLTDPVLSPFWSLPAVVGMLLAQGLEPAAHGVAAALFWTCFTIAQLFGGWLLGEWMAGNYDARRLHPGYLLPTVAAGLIGAAGAAAFGHEGLGWMAFGTGAVSGVIFSAVLLGRLIVAEPMPVGLTPTLAIQLAPPAVAGNAYFALHGLHADPIAFALAGYVVTTLAAQLRLIGLYRKLSFEPTFWAFSFAAAAAAALGLRWLSLRQPRSETVLAWADATVITCLVAAIAVKTALGLRRGTFLPMSAALPREGVAGSQSKPVG